MHGPDMQPMLALVHHPSSHLLAAACRRRQSTEVFSFKYSIWLSVTPGRPVGIFGIFGRPTNGRRRAPPAGWPMTKFRWVCQSSDQNHSTPPIGPAAPRPPDWGVYVPLGKGFYTHPPPLQAPALQLRSPPLPQLCCERCVSVFFRAFGLEGFRHLAGQAVRDGEKVWRVGEAALEFHGTS